MVSYNKRDLKYFRLGIYTGIDNIYKKLMKISKEEQESKAIAEEIIELGEELRYLLDLRKPVSQDIEVGSS